MGRTVPRAIMNILAKQTLAFADYGGVLTGSGTVVTVTTSPKPQTVPDWVRNTLTWASAAKSGLVLEIPVAVPDSFSDGGEPTKPPAVAVEPMVAQMKPEDPPAEPEDARKSKRK